jgi:cytochrome P450
MPPSGFNEKAIRGLLQFVEGCYDDLLKEMSSPTGEKDVRKAIAKELVDIRAALESFSLESETREKVDIRRKSAKRAIKRI